MSDNENKATSVPPRPSRRDEDVIVTAARWLVDYCKRGWEDFDVLVVEVVRAMQFSTDGYKIARNLENTIGLEPDADLVSLLNAADRMLREAEIAAVKQWVKKYNISPHTDFDAAVRIIQGPKSGITGTVFDIRESTAEFLVNCPSEGHVEKGKRGIHGVWVPYEHVEVLK